MIPKDPLFADQWHLRNTGQLGEAVWLDINVVDVWDDYTGAGIHVAVWDSGVLATHEDLAAGYDASLHIADPKEVLDPTVPADTHGTNVAGVIAARANNGLGGVGIAFDATLTSIKPLGDHDFVNLAMNELDRFDIANFSNGPDSLDDSRLLPAFALQYQGIQDAVDNGRDGLGTILNFAAGNERPINDNVNLSTFTSIRFANAIGFVQDIGTLSTSDPGAALLVVAPAEDSDIGTSVPFRHVTTTNSSGNSAYDDDFGSTSGATPMVSGICALMLEANPELGWRDVQTILAASARHIGSDIGATALVSLETRPWTFNKATTWNGGGYHFSHDYGFGLVDALAAVRLAETWTAQSTSANETKRTGSFKGPLKTKDFETKAFDITLAKGLAVEAIELELKWSTQHTAIEDLIIELVSPAGTKSYLLDENLGGAGALPDWIFTSRTFLGERSGGTWTVRIHDVTASDSGVVSGATLRAYGSKDNGDDTYIYTNEFGDYAGKFDHKATFKDSDGGKDAINAAAVTSSSWINLSPGKHSEIDGKSLKTHSDAVIEDAFGGDGDDTLIGNGVANTLRGGRGDDRLSGGAKGDKLVGDDGLDYARYASAPGWVKASLLKGGSVGHADGDTYKSIEGLVGSDFGDTLEGNFLANTLWGGGGDDDLDGRIGPDVLRGQSGQDELFGGSGDDALYGGKGDDGLRGGKGNDHLNGSLGADDLDGGSGFDFAVYKFATSKVKADLTTGGLIGEAAGDEYAGIEGLLGSGFHDDLRGNAKTNILIGGEGNDDLYGRGGDDALFGDDGKDELIGGPGADTLDGGEGFDVAKFGLSATGVVASLVDGGLTGEAAGDAYFNMEGLSGTVYDDVLVGDDAANDLLGRGGDDALAGQGGDDFLFGDTNKDTLIGGLGRDSLAGGKGADVFDFDAIEDSKPGTPDLIIDFEDGLDRIDLSTIDAATGSRFDIVNDTFVFIGANTFSGIAGQVRTVLSSGHTYIYGDTNGDSFKDFEIEIAAAIVLGAGDFIL